MSKKVSRDGVIVSVCLLCVCVCILSFDIFVSFYSSHYGLSSLTLHHFFFFLLSLLPSEHPTKCITYCQQYMYVYVPLWNSPIWIQIIHSKVHYIFSTIAYIGTFRKRNTLFAQCDGSSLTFPTFLTLSYVLHEKEGKEPYSYTNLAATTTTVNI